MSRDQRMRDNWALLYALEAAAKTGAPCAVAFNLVPEYLGAGARQFCFMLKVRRIRVGVSLGLSRLFCFMLKVRRITNNLYFSHLTHNLSKSKKQPLHATQIPF